MYTDNAQTIEEDEKDVQELLTELKKEVSSMPAEVQFTEGTRHLSKAFMLKLTEISHKYQLMAALMVKNQ